MISIITPSIRPDGLKIVFDSLQSQTYRDFEWLPRLSIPIPGKPDLCYQMNRALAEAKGEWIVFWQDYISLPKDGLLRIARLASGNQAVTFPVLKDGQGDWRSCNDVLKEIEFHQWEIDLAVVSRETVLEVGGFEEEGDARGAIGGEEKILASKLHWRKNVKFFVDPTVVGQGTDHDSFLKHPHKGVHQEPNMEFMRARMMEEQIRAIDRIPKE